MGSLLLKFVFSFKNISISLLILIFLSLGAASYYAYEELLLMKENIAGINSKLRSLSIDVQDVKSDVSSIDTSDIDTVRSTVDGLESTIRDIQFDVSRIVRALRY